MIITTIDSDLYEKVVEIPNYRPSAEELFYYYKGTSTLNPNNPYARKNNYMTRTTYRKVAK